MIDDDREIGMALEHRQQRLEFARLHESIEAQTQLRQCRQRRLHVGPEDPRRLGWNTWLRGETSPDVSTVFSMREN